MMRTERSFLGMENLRLRSMDELNPPHGMKIMQTIKSCAPVQINQSIRSMVATDTIPLDEVSFSYCTNVTVLKLLRVRMKILDLNALRHLRSLEYDSGWSLVSSNIAPPAVKVRGLARLSNLVVLLLDGIPGHSSWIEAISGLTKLQILRLDSGTRWRPDDKHEIKYPNLRKLWSLRDVTMTRFRNRANTISGFSKRMSFLRILDLSECSFLRCDGVGDLVALEELNLSYCKKLNELPNLQSLTRLRKLNIRNCGLTRALPGFGALIALEVLQAAGCFKLAQLLDLRKLIHLQVLNTSSGLVDSRGVELLTGLSNLTGLLKFNFYFCDFKDVSCLSHFSTLRELIITNCDKLERLPDIHKLTRLEMLEIYGCESLRIWEGLRGSRLLETVISDHGNGAGVYPLLIETLECNGVPVTELPDARSFPHLKHLYLSPPLLYQ
ncbi:hypothetical protein M758_8G013600 [Ceratodon purpureus]|nr:hypothetical protein M758_8G013600 [Ceratodon purpureus]